MFNVKCEKKNNIRKIFLQGSQDLKRPHLTADFSRVHKTVAIESVCQETI